MALVNYSEDITAQMNCYEYRWIVINYGDMRMMPKKQILLVDDDCHIREVLKLSLERHGYKPFEASNGSHAIELCRSKTFDLVITVC